MSRRRCRKMWTGSRWRPWGTWFVDAMHDVILGAAATAGSPNRGSVLAALRASVLRRAPYGSAGGLPGVVRIDRGEDFLSATVREALGGIGGAAACALPVSEVEPGDLTIRGVAWSGAAPIARVDVSVDSGPWHQTRPLGRWHRHSWQWWELIVVLKVSGPHTIRARATDLAGRNQPNEPEWNRLGYGSNAIQEVSVQVETSLDGPAQGRATA